VNLSNRRSAPRRTTSSMTGEALAGTRVGVLCGDARLLISGTIGATVDPVGGQLVPRENDERER
jgi:hypothetical protein